MTSALRTIITITIISAPSFLPRSSRSIWRGVISFSLSCTISAIFPNSVCIPVEVIIARPFPAVIAVPWKTIFFMSPITGRSKWRGFVILRTAWDSPVSAASSAEKPTAYTTRPSAGILSPASSVTKSPGTISRDSIVFHKPSRITVALGAAISFNASSACSDLNS